jgi:branched-chain amino acid transport system substrate-binding protein
VRNLLAILAVLTICFAAARAADKEPFVINVIDPLTGSSAYLGNQLHTVIQLYEQVVNRQGGINGQPVHFNFFDDESQPLIAVQLLHQLADQHVAVVLGPDSQAECRAVLPFTAHGPVVYCFTPGIVPPPGYLFAAGADITHTEHVLLKYAHDSGAKRLALLVENDATGQGSDRLLPITLAKPDLAGMNVVAYEHFDPSSISVAAQVAAIKAANPDYLYISATGTPFQTVIRGIVDGGLTVPIVTSSANMDLKTLAPFGTTMPRIGFNAPPFWDDRTGQSGPIKTVVTEYRNAFKTTNVAPSPNDEFGWDTASIYVAAFRKLGTNATADQVHAFIEGLHDFPGLGGLYDFRTGNQHGLGENNVIVVQYDPVHPRFFAVSKPGGSPL